MNASLFAHFARHPLKQRCKQRCRYEFDRVRGVVRDQGRERERAGIQPIELVRVGCSGFIVVRDGVRGGCVVRVSGVVGWVESCYDVIFFKKYAIILLCVVAFLASLELIPLLVSSIFGVNYGATTVGIVHQRFNDATKLAYISWIAFNFMAIFAIFVTIKSSLKIWLKTAIVAAIVAVLYICVYPILSIVNIILMLSVRNPPFITGDDAMQRFPQARSIEQNAQHVRSEYEAFAANNVSPCINDTITGFQISVPTEKKGCWHTIILKKQGVFEKGVRRSFPRTCRLLQDAQIHNAVFSILDANVNIPYHVGYYKGYLRYHLGVEIPRGGQKGPAFIVCGKKRYEWRQGKGVLFDDMYPHMVENPTNKQRVVLYLDVLRNDIPAWFAPAYLATNVYIETHPVLKLIVKAQHKSSKQMSSEYTARQLHLWEKI